MVDFKKTLGLRIKQKRIELGLTQEELAFKLGYKSKSTINKIELGKNDLHQTKLLAFAEALNTTPAFLLGIEKERMDNEQFVLNKLATNINFYRRSKKITPTELAQFLTNNTTKVFTYKDISNIEKGLNKDILKDKNLLDKIGECLGMRGEELIEEDWLKQSNLKLLIEMFTALPPESKSFILGAVLKEYNKVFEEKENK